MSKEWDIVVYGATGFTGRLVCEYLSSQYGTGGEVSWAMAGRSQQKLEQVRGELGISDAIPLVVADAADTASIDAMVAQSKVVLTTVGPYQLYGSDLVKACAAAGTDNRFLVRQLCRCGLARPGHERSSVEGQQDHRHVNGAVVRRR